MKKTYLIILAGFILCTTFGLFLYFQKPTVMAEGSLDGKLIVMNENSWTLQFSERVRESTINNKNIVVKDSEGHAVAVTFELSDDRKTLTIHPPAGGYPEEPRHFTLSITSGVKTNLGFSYDGDTEFTFAVTEDIPSIASKEELAQYFQTIIKKQKLQQRHSEFSLFGNSNTESSEDKAASAGGESSGSEHSETNNQVQGVDEGDIVKTDGTYIYQVVNQQLVISRAVPADSMKMVSRLTFKENIQPQHLFLEKDKVVIIGNSWSHEAVEATEKIMPRPMNGSTVAMIYDISNKEKPSLVRKVAVEGHYMTSRKIEDTLYFVSSLYPDYWLADKNPEVDLRPRVMDSAEGEEVKAIPAARINYFPQSMQPNYTMIAALDIENPKAEFNVQSYLGSGNGIYMSKENLYIAVEKMEDPERWDVSSTEVYKFGVKDSEITYKASGKVPGRILNQFSMDEHEGYFRMATTDGEVWNDDKPSSNALYILDENMKKTGEVTNLAKGERIYSVRFMGDKAYIVTFKQVDPLFVIDTADPEQPKVLGELKIPGFSTYLHPIDENHLIGFGFDTKIMDDGKSFNEEPRIIRSGMKLSLFDITDFHNPKEADTEIIGGRGTHSYLLEDHKALFHEPSRNLYGFPISVYHDKEGSEYEQVFDYQGALLYEITPEKGIERKAKLAEDDQKQKDVYENWENNIQRLLYINDTVYTLSNSRIDAYSLNDFTKESSLLLQ
ncbi:beta-propeller domain-containing protein [Bacillus sp. Marseille-Q1617]|uniref:beta-propeller domain-containing protein n=1 Tax=Bacillus sp. Marseille-Q1617 TaxID=2736887 RepID=UPI00158EC207|nr:beta-propeller domain-containing protein [Bacillus sp. Marseille-Q1617]